MEIEFATRQRKRDFRSAVAEEAGQPAKRLARICGALELHG
jgi:hypothetical protein